LILICPAASQWPEAGSANEASLKWEASQQSGKTILRNEKSLGDVKRKENKDLVARIQNLEEMTMVRRLTAECQGWSGDSAQRSQAGSQRQI
jgi:hypothetical protein